MVGHGEDAPPLLVNEENGCAVGVFDGMGGSGAALCESDLGKDYTKAYVASRIVSSSVEAYLKEHIGTNDILVNDLKEVIAYRLRQEQERFPPQSKSLLRSKLVRDYPTTMALVTLTKSEKSMDIDSYWAGDSHCYLWEKDGFFQISLDDLEEKNDPMENLHNDSPISNCICADRDFIINHRHLQLSKEPVIILCATDGCFGYYQTPMHFEYILSDCLQRAKNEEEWKLLVKDELLKVTGDDCSLSLIAIGYKSFDELKMSKKSHTVTGFPELIKQEKTIAWAKEELEKENNKYLQNIAEGWKIYKQTYMKYLND